MPRNPIDQLDLERLMRDPQALVRKLVAGLVFAPPLSMGGGGGALARPERLRPTLVSRRQRAEDERS